MNVYHCRQKLRGFIPWKKEANCRLHWQHVVPWRYPVLQAFPVKLLAPAKCYIWSFPSPWGSRTVNSYGFGVYSEIELFCVAASYPQVSLKTRFFGEVSKTGHSQTVHWSCGDDKHIGLNQRPLATSISSYEARIWKRSTQKFFPTWLNWFHRFRQWYCFLPSPLLSSWATENQPTAWQSRQLSPLILGPIAAIAGCLSGYQGISSHIITCFSAASGAAPGGFFWGIWSCVFCSKPTWRLWVVETGDDYTELLFRWESCS